ncbi:hypothetical protein EOC93_16320 [Mesorhizobium sp. M6A.T.Ce.TU.002.03.1.1]|nr:hypothetical protein EOC93_16320 [Mesorhizobium sp. M6A.T.Ce.TU.002.03.1.1]
MPGRAEGGAVPLACQPITATPQGVSGWEWVKSRVGDPSPPLSCRTSPPQGGRLDAASAFANHHRWKTGQGECNLKRLPSYFHCFVTAVMLGIYSRR